MKPKYKPQQTFSVAKDGFFGEYYPATGEKFKGKSLVIFGGSMGLFLLTQMLAEKFVDEGMSVMAIAYHVEEGLPKELKDQPVDVVEKAAQWLKNNGYEKVGVWGISMGGCLALLAASMMPELISCVVSVAPMEMVPQAEEKLGKNLLNGSAFSWHGKSLPYMKFVPSNTKECLKKYRRDSWKHKEPYSKDMLIDSYAANDNPEAVIKIWNIKGPILLQGSVNDSMCPDEETISRMEKQLADHNFAYPVETHIYPHISHLIVPIKPYSTKMFRAERKNPEGCAQDRIDLWNDTLRFLEEKWV